jgi:hypothetical protein
MEIDKIKREAGEYCRKGVPGCLCKAGYPPEEQHEVCREKTVRDSFCVCPPPPLCERCEESGIYRDAIVNLFGKRWLCQKCFCYTCLQHDSDTEDCGRVEELLKECLERAKE